MLSFNHLLLLPKLLATNYFSFSFLSIVPRYYKKLTTDGGLQKVEMLLQKQKQNSRRSKLNETLIVLKK
jgi:hypothetical protein